MVTVQRPVLAPLHTRAETTSETQTRAHAGWQGGAGPVVAAACLASCLLDLPPHKHTQHPLLKTTTPQVGKEELIQFLRRTSRGSGPQGGNGTSSAYRGVSKHVKGRWEARIGLAPVDGKRRYRWVGGGTCLPFPCLLAVHTVLSCQSHLTACCPLLCCWPVVTQCLIATSTWPPTAAAPPRYLGLFDTEEEAAVAYDRAAVELKGAAAILNYPITHYLDCMDAGGCCAAGGGAR